MFVRPKGKKKKVVEPETPKTVAYAMLCLDRIMVVYLPEGEDPQFGYFHCYRYLPRHPDLMVKLFPRDVERQVSELHDQRLAERRKCLNCGTIWYTREQGPTCVNCGVMPGEVALPTLREKKGWARHTQQTWKNRRVFVEPGSGGVFMVFVEGPVEYIGILYPGSVEPYPGYLNKITHSEVATLREMLKILGSQLEGWGWVKNG